MSKRRAFALAALLGAVLPVTVALALGAPAIDWWVSGGGGAPAGGGRVNLNDTLGQPVSGQSSGGNVRLAAGYWYGAVIDDDETRCGLLEAQTYGFNPVWEVQVTVDRLGDIGCLRVQRADQNHPNATSGLQTGRYWTLSAENASGDPASGFDLTLTLPADFVPDGSDKVCRYTGTDLVWDCEVSSHDPANQTVTRTGVTQLSDWAVGDNVDPTAVVLSRLQAHSPAGSLVGWMILVGLISIAGAGLMVARGARRQAR